MAEKEGKGLKEVKQDIVKQDLGVKSIIQEIWECDSSLEDLHQLNVEVAREVNLHKECIDELEKLTWETKKPLERDALWAELDGFRHQLESNFCSLRKANLFSRKIIEEKSKQELFQLNEEPSLETRPSRRGNAKNEKGSSIATKATTVTEELLSVSRLMATQVTQSEHTLHALVNSSATVTETHEEFKTMGNVIVQSRKLLVKYGRREVTDKVLIFLALAFFFACVLYVMTKRLF